MSRGTGETADLDLPATGRLLRAGPATVELHGERLRYVRLGDVELVRRIYPAIRDHNWGTVPPVVSGLHVEEDIDSFRVTFDARHLRGELDFAWQATIVGTAAGEISYTLDGLFQRDCDYNRVGLCLLHPVAQAGAQYTSTLGGRPTRGRIPTVIAAQRWEDGVFHPAFGPFDKLVVSASPNLDMTLTFTGDEFEFEDQRNWADGSFKTYSTPLINGWPHHATAGQRLTQTVIMSLAGSAVAGSTPAPTARVDQGEAVRTVLRVGPPTGTPLPDIGLQAGLDGSESTDAVVTALRRLRLAHLRVDLRPEEVPESPQLSAAVEMASALDVPLEVALHLPHGDVDAAVSAVLALPETLRVERLLLLRGGFDVGDGPLAVAVRERLPDLPIMGGTAGNFAEINRAHVDVDGLDGLVFPLASTVHDSDGLSVLESIESVGAIVRSAQSIGGVRPVAVSPLTLRPQHNLFAAWTLDDATDARQATAFAAGWLLGVIAQLAESGAACVTTFEPTGPRGVLDAAGEPHPVFTVLAELAAHREDQPLSCHSSAPLRVVALALAGRDAVWVLTANLRPEPAGVRVVLAGPATRARAYRMSALTAYGSGLTSAQPEYVDLDDVRLSPFDVVLLTTEN